MDDANPRPQSHDVSVPRPPDASAAPVPGTVPPVPGVAPAPAGDDPEPPPNGHRTFLHVLVNTAVANTTTSFLWFGLTFWVYLETRSVLATGVIGGAYMLLVAVFSMFFGTLVDRFRKHRVMLLATIGTLAMFALSGIVYLLHPEAVLLDLRGPWFWIFAVILLAGAVVEQLRNIALSTTVSLLVPGPRRANANGLVGTVQGLAFLVTSVFSGLAIGLLGMGWTLLISVVLIAGSVAHLLMLTIPEPVIVHAEGQAKWVDVRGGFRAVLAAPGLLALVIFTTLNNLVAGVYIALTDPYGIEVFGSVELWGVALAVVSSGFMLGGAVIAKFGLGRNPIRTMLLFAALIGVVGAVFAIRDWWWLYGLGLWVFFAIMPAVEAAEQTVIQRVVPFRQQGRVFGFAMTFEAAAAPVTAFLIAPITEFWTIPYMESAAGRATWGWLLGDGQVRGIALVFVGAGIVATLLGLGAFLTRSYRLLSSQYAEAVKHDTVTA
ncbi:DHA3 family multidrug efflux protein-like MFS transporter [Brevibacterium sanguinis]|uniref:DHA3 family multidrug efflux protein-like MFS transporter n=2 Tax=Brevibacterium TaxID=1696 RepID=A0A366IE25_9MICO|nr:MULTISPECIES: MFS transporter [Brevibacterium]RBP62794.1 DHA3 family multidrug efflux protein-like MFS transporter [Brevibacterium sanguinis]RBP69359.1 DHA3 family multidrug efflux protein-like MFS transporter [Brevibacterium celere]